MVQQRREQGSARARMRPAQQLEGEFNPPPVVEGLHKGFVTVWSPKSPLTSKGAASLCLHLARSELKSQRRDGVS
eukprot:CAMPEP_0118924912 /NCGR_PEP_ID=MMETSP1169-20130426/2844_1 /TAXON_ID=36882 /ORGANISM="Pyramimonas obovata, Strain CCMP722" /LENGTH=74 /DNA_ID=CAMNT_0006866061 /DNA_START=192 /DNA_END=413 /DNA_ORIENTATION=-